MSSRGGVLSKGEWKGTGWVGPETLGALPSWASLTLPPARSLCGWVSSHVSASLTLSGGPGPLPRRLSRHSAGHSGLRAYWLAGPAPVSHSSSSSRISLSALPLLGPLPLPVLPPLCISPHLSVSPISPSLPVSCLSLSLRLSPSLPARVDPGGSRTARPGPARPGAAANNAPFTRPAGAMATRPPRPPRACQEDAMVTSGACPPRAPPPRAPAGPGPAGGARPHLCGSRAGPRSSRGLGLFSASVSPSVKRQGPAQ